MLLHDMYELVEKIDRVISLVSRSGELPDIFRNRMLTLLCMLKYLAFQVGKQRGAVLYLDCRKVSKWCGEVITSQCAGRHMARLSLLDKYRKCGESRRYYVVPVREVPELMLLIVLEVEKVILDLREKLTEHGVDREWFEKFRRVLESHLLEIVKAVENVRHVRQVREAV